MRGREAFAGGEAMWGDGGHFGKHTTSVVKEGIADWKFFGNGWRTCVVLDGNCIWTELTIYIIHYRSMSFSISKVTHTRERERMTWPVVVSLRHGHVNELLDTQKSHTQESPLSLEHLSKNERQGHNDNTNNQYIKSLRLSTKVLQVGI